MVFGLFGSKVERLKKAVRQRYGQHEPRKDAMMRLLQMADLEAYLPSRAALRSTVTRHTGMRRRRPGSPRLLERQGMRLFCKPCKSSDDRRAPHQALGVAEHGER